MISLDMTVECIDGVWLVDAPWLDYPIEAPSFHEAYWAAVMARPRR